MIESDVAFRSATEESTASISSPRLTLGTVSRRTRRARASARRRRQPVHYLALRLAARGAPPAGRGSSVARWMTRRSHSSISEMRRASSAARSERIAAAAATASTDALPARRMSR